jgi:hypothetical protein
MRWRTLAVLIPLFAGVSLVCGCAAKQTTISGEVTLDDKPLEQGTITFVPVDGKTPNVVTTIKAGKYSVKATPGSMRVQISWQKVVGKRKAYDDAASPLVDEYKEGLPARYNENTELTAEVKNGDNVFNWPLKSK